MWSVRNRETEGQEEAERGAGGSFPGVSCPREGVCLDSGRRLAGFLGRDQMGMTLKTWNPE